MTKEFLKEAFKGKRIFLTGHTGFKGAWMVQVLHWLGAQVKGYSLAPEQEQDLYNGIRGDELCYASVMADIRHREQLQGEMVRFEPDYVFHLAAQSLVRRSYESPSETFSVNTQGTVHVLEAMRALPHPCTGLIITTDKVYENPERGMPFRETDKLGGYDPYSASKAAAEIVTASYIRSFFNPDRFGAHGKSVATVRAGNVIGGGDYSEDRIVPDIVRALERGQQVKLRNPSAVRPWQHVLEPISGYLILAAKMKFDPISFGGGAFNFGPELHDEKPVEELTRIFLSAYGREGQYEVASNPNAPHEASNLLLDSTKAELMLGWRPRLNASAAIYWTAEWYSDKSRGAREKCMEQIRKYFQETNVYR